jgi:hypothetical protein
MLVMHMMKNVVKLFRESNLFKIMKILKNYTKNKLRSKKQINNLINKLIKDNVN